MSSNHEGHDDHGQVHIAPASMYFFVGGSLFILTAVTYFVAQFDFGALNDPIAVGIAVFKASLVVLFFMHVKYASRLIKMVVSCAVIWVMIMFGLTLVDYQSREAVVPSPQDVPPSVAIDESLLPPPPLDHGDGH